MKTHAAIRASIDRLFVRRRLSARGFRDLRAHLAECEACRAYYDRVARLDAAFAGHDGEGSIGLAGLERAVVSAEPKRSLFARFGIPLVAALSLIVVVVYAGNRWTHLGSDPRPPRAEDPGAVPGLTPRGDELAPRPARVRPICVARDGTGTVTADEPTRNQTASSVRITRCTMNDDLVLAYAYSGDPMDARFLFVVGLDRRVVPLWYTPRPDEVRSLPVGPLTAGDWARLPGATRLGVNHRPGLVRVFALFSREPIEMSDVAAAAERLRSAGVDPTTLADLPIRGSGLVTAVADVEVVP